MFKVNKNPNIVNFDVDDTLVTTTKLDGVIPLEITSSKGHIGFLYPIWSEINALKDAHLRDHFVRVHSQGGWKWAVKVILALGLENFVNEIETKAKWYHDDIPADKWMIRFYSGPLDKVK